MPITTLWQRLRQQMSRTRETLVTSIDTLVRRHGLAPAFYDELEEALVAADVGAVAASRMIERLRREPLTGADGASVRGALARIMAAEMKSYAGPLRLDDPGLPRPRTALLVGVNGSGKTTTAGKLAHHVRERGGSAMLVAADTFRAAAEEQLSIWARRAGAEMVRGAPGQDPGAVAFDGVQAARARGFDTVLVDTAGRLHNKAQLMAELAKIRRVVEKALGRAPDEVLLVMDATTGQNGLVQATVFTEAVAVTGLVLTKLDGTARGGIAFRIATELGIPIKLIGVGEAPEDLRAFEPESFAAALVGAGVPGDDAGS